MYADVDDDDEILYIFIFFRIQNVVRSKNLYLMCVMEKKKKKIGKIYVYFLTRPNKNFHVTAPAAYTQLRTEQNREWTKIT